jgi:hypothetical protein
MRIDAPQPAAMPEPTGWSPGAVAPAPSTRAAGLLRGGLDAWLGHAERAEGVPLTSVQVALLAPVLAGAAMLAEDVVRADLARVRIQVGGLAAGAGNVATTVGTNVYVSDAARATQILSWSGRGWLAHELGHTMQWRRLGPQDGSDSARDRRFLDAYVGAYAAHDGSLKRGGFFQAATELLRRHRAGEPAGNVGDLLHDTHPFEREANAISKAFRDATA